MSSPETAALAGGPIVVDATPMVEEAVKSPGRAVLHAVPAIALLVSYLWIAIAVPVVLLELRLPGVPAAGWVVLAALAVPGSWLSWRIVRQCIAVERVIA